MLKRIVCRICPALLLLYGIVPFTVGYVLLRLLSGATMLRIRSHVAEFFKISASFFMGSTPGGKGLALYL